MVANLAATVLAAPLLARGRLPPGRLDERRDLRRAGAPRGHPAGLDAARRPAHDLAARRDRAGRVALPRDAPGRARRVAAPSRRAPGPAAGGGHGRADGVRRVLPAGRPGARRGHRRHPAADRDHRRRPGGRHRAASAAPRGSAAPAVGGAPGGGRGAGLARRPRHAVRRLRRDRRSATGRSTTRCSWARPGCRTPSPAPRGPP